MFKFVLVCALVAVTISSPIPYDEVRKTGNIQKTSEYYLTAESKPPAPKTTGLARPSPINPNIQSDPKPQESGKIIPAALTYGEAKSAVKPGAASVDHHVVESTNVDSTKVSAPVPAVSRSTNPAAHLESNPSIASPAAASDKSSQPIIVGAERKIVKRDSPSDHAEQHEQHHTTSTQASTDSDSHHKLNKPLSSSNNDESSSYDRDNQPPKYVHPVPISQIIKNTPPAEIHHHQEE